MTEILYSEEDRSRHNQILRLISEKEQKYFYSFVYGSIFIFLYVVRSNLESGGLLGVTTLLATLSFGMWLGTNPMIHKFEVFYHIKGDEPESITQRFSTFSKTSNKIGVISVLSMLIGSWIFIW
jgi:hypothetical protein